MRTEFIETHFLFCPIKASACSFLLPFFLLLVLCNTCWIFLKQTVLVIIFFLCLNIRMPWRERLATSSRLFNVRCLFGFLFLLLLLIMMRRRARKEHTANILRDMLKNRNKTHPMTLRSGLKTYTCLTSSGTPSCHPNSALNHTIQPWKKKYQLYWKHTDRSFLCEVAL